MLTDKQIRALQPREKLFVISDGRSARGEGVLLLKIRLIASGSQRPQQLLGTTRKQYFDDHLVIRNLKGVDGERILHAVPYNRLMRQSLKTLDEISEISVYRFMGKMEDKPLHTVFIEGRDEAAQSTHKVVRWAVHTPRCSTDL